jgi:putative PIN family toxin of toxin-antitoxin system
VRAVFDANVLLAALARGGTCDRALRLAISRHRVVTSAPILAEVRGKLVEKFRFAPEAALEMTALLRRVARVVRPIALPRTACRDPDDVVVLGTALRARAACIVTGDGDLLVLGEFRGVAIVTPRTFLTLGERRLEEE